ncbi:50S ribosomal protein L10 [Halobacteriales archaeon QS_8_69_26]|nr:MAG: 50S ribosomal protein L10 [Halobacteriales archaeon QS_8_69_26]
MSEAEQQRKTEEIPEWKRHEAAELVDLIEGYESIGVVSIAGIPSRQLQDMRRELHGSAEIRVSRNTLLRRALEATGKGDLVEYVSGQVGLIGTDDNPFGLYQQLEESKTPAPINAGEIAPNDIVIPEGDTGVDDGQFIGDLKQIGVDSRFQDGAIFVTEESVALEEGGEVSPQLSNVLATLGIEPKEVGLDLSAVLSDGVVFESDDLDIDLEGYRDDLVTAAAQAHNLAVNAAVPSPDTLPTLLSKAAGEARAVGLEAAIADPELIDDLLARADADVRALAAQVDDEEALPEELRGVEKPAAEPADEAAAEDDEPEDDDEEAEAEEADEDDDDDEADGAAGLGDMFG